MARRPVPLRAAAVLLAGMAALALAGGLLLWVVGALFGPDTLVGLAEMARRLRPVRLT